MMSLPLWECGLKSQLVNNRFPTRQSLPLWECGLKSYGVPQFFKGKYVTPLVGVWIEIARPQEATEKIKSLPLWECGLK